VPPNQCWYCSIEDTISISGCRPIDAALADKSPGFVGINGIRSHQEFE
jgi:hypothetical protein